VFLLVPAYPGSPRQRAIKRLCVFMAGDIIPAEVFLHNLTTAIVKTAPHDRPSDSTNTRVKITRSRSYYNSAFYASSFHDKATCLGPGDVSFGPVAVACTLHIGGQYSVETLRPLCSDSLTADSATGNGWQVVNTSSHRGDNARNQTYINKPDLESSPSNN